MTKQNVFTNEELYEEIKAEAKKYSKQKKFVNYYVLNLVTAK